MKYISKNEVDTEKLASALAKNLKKGDIVFLEGDLGAGKTVFARSIIRTLLSNDSTEVPSPTYTLVQTYEANIGELWHFDLYRIEDAEEIYELGWEESIADRITIVEWPERLSYLTPSQKISVQFEPSATEPNHRSIQILNTKKLEGINSDPID